VQQPELGGSHGFSECVDKTWAVGVY
jgi:hypothetical protein